MGALEASLSTVVAEFSVVAAQAFFVRGSCRFGSSCLALPWPEILERVHGDRRRAKSAQAGNLCDEKYARACFLRGVTDLRADAVTDPSGHA